MSKIRNIMSGLVALILSFAVATVPAEAHSASHKRGYSETQGHPSKKTIDGFLKNFPHKH